METLKNKKTVYFPKATCWEELIFCFQQYFNCNITEDFKLADIIIFPNFSLEDRKLLLKNKYLYNKNIFVYIHEPLIDNDDCAYNKKMIRRIKMFKFINIITYSIPNLILSKKLLGNYRKYFYLPINFFNSPDQTFNKINNGMIIHRNAHNGIHSAKRSKHNLNIFPIQNIKKYNLKILNLWGKERNTLFKNTKIFINLHKKKHANFLETLRIHNLIYNRIIIISEPVSDQSDYLSSYVIYTNDYIKVYNDILENYQQYYDKIYGNKTNKEIFKDINQEYIKFYNIYFNI